MGWTRWWLLPLGAIVAAIVVTSCSGNGDDFDTNDGGTDGPSLVEDGGRNPHGGSDAGEDPDGGTDPDPDGGTDLDGGSPDGGEIILPSAEGWTFYGPQHGGPREVYGVTADRNGNMWVAGGAEGLFLLEPGASTFKRFTHEDGLGSYNDGSGVKGYDVISVAGGPGSSVFVGYKGVNDDGHDEDDPVWMLKSGDADRVVYDGAGLTVTHFDISSPPGLYSQYPNGREKVRHIYRIVYDDKTGNVWFGGDHGVGMYEARSKMVWEHQHVTINGYRKTAAEDPAGASYTPTMSGDWRGLAIDPAGDVWMGGAHRVGKLRYASEGGQFWASFSPNDLDVWPDRVSADARPEDRTDDHVSDMIADANGVWIGSSWRGLARWTSSGISYIPNDRMIDGKVTALERDPEDGSLWVGHLWGGLTRISNGTYTHYSETPFGRPIIDGVVRDIQSDRVSGQRRILVAFSGGVVAVYTGQ